jgi:hypothetical protein
VVAVGKVFPRTDVETDCAPVVLHKRFIDKHCISGNFFIKFDVVKEASRISYHEWQQSIGVIWNKHWTFGA